MKQKNKIWKFKSKIFRKFKCIKFNKNINTKKKKIEFKGKRRRM